MRQLIALFRALTLNFIRDKQSVFFSLAFPLVFLLIFGSVFQDNDVMSDAEPNVSISAYFDKKAPGSRELEEVLAGMEHLSISLAPSREAAIEDVRDRNVSFGLSWDGGELVFYMNPVYLQQKSYHTQVARSISDAFDKKRAGIVDFMVVAEQEVVARAGITHLEYMIPGIIAIAILSTGLSTIAGSLMRFKEQGVLKRMLATPMRFELFLISLIFTRMLVAFVAALIILVVSHLVFKVQFSINWPLFVLFTMVSTFAMMAFGALITLFVSKAQTAGQLAGVFVTIMIFFSGTYFPMELLPDYLFQLAKFLPLTYVHEGMRYVMRVETLNIQRFSSIVTIMVCVSLVIIWFVARRRSWQEA
ncbi:MAG: ABC transporter permease [Limnochordia bacterium]|jgi:ABC-2 type transport system permease protein|nr:ABC transporter permease [Limnochordia bacterium]MDD2630765.1 ABC transporter permease [Limnochordia bacterium]